MWLRLRLLLLVGLLFAILYTLFSLIGFALGLREIYFYVFMLLLAGILVFIQYLIGPKVVEISMMVKYVSEKEYPELHRIVEELSREAGIPKPRVGVSGLNIPNAFAFGRTKRDARVCVTKGLLNLLNEKELRAVLGHEISHIKHKDVFVITMLSVIPTICYMIYVSFFWSSIYSRRRDSGALALIGLTAFLLYLITSLLVMYASRIREYYADYGSVELGNKPNWLATALYKLVYGSARADRNTIKRVAGMKAFFLNDPANAVNEISELKQVDLNLDGVIDEYELQVLAERKIKLSKSEKIMELLSSHPSTLKRIKALSNLVQ
ncbi:MAG: M48 family metalloprotease [Thermoplasmata archaeon]|nr:M48 family metalloprotease [Thermoplasmata archaeon]